MTFVDSSVVTPGVYHDVKLVPNGEVPSGPRTLVLIEHRLSSAPSSYDNVPVLIRSRADSQLKYGAGSPLDLALGKALGSGGSVRSQSPPGTIPQVVAVAVPPPSAIGDVAAEFTLTITGTPSARGSVVLYVGEQTHTVTVLQTDTPTTIAARAVESMALSANDSYVTASAVAGVITLVGRTSSVHGNDVVVHADTAASPGVSVAVAQSVVGVGVSDITAALAASLAVDPYVVAVAQSDASTVSAVNAHIENALSYSIDKPHVVLVGHGGTWLDAAAVADDIDSYSVAVVSVAKETGLGPPPFDFPACSRSMAVQAIGAVGATLLSQPSPVYNYNLAVVPLQGVANYDENDLNEVQRSGVMAVANKKKATRIISPLSTAVRDQTGATTAPSRQHSRLEIAFTVHEIRRLLSIVLDTLAQAGQNDGTLARARSAAFDLLERLSALQWISRPEQTDVNVRFETNGGRTDLIVDVAYEVRTGIGLVAVTSIVRTTGA